MQIGKKCFINTKGMKGPTTFAVFGQGYINYVLAKSIKGKLRFYY